MARQTRQIQWIQKFPNGPRWHQSSLPPWWADTADSKAVAVKLLVAAAASIEWAVENGVAFDYGKTEAALFHKKRKVPMATVAVGTNDVPFNKEATQWLEVWHDAQLMLKEHHSTRMKEARKAMTRLQ